MPTPASNEAVRARQVSLILERLEALPTLSPIATRLLGATSGDKADISKIVGLIECDPALSARILGLCRRADRALGDRVRTVKHAVVMLGLDAVRSAVLAVSVYDAMGSAADDLDRTLAPGAVNGLSTARRAFDRAGFWKHSLAAACAAELIAGEHRALRVKPDEAFAAALLHDLGKLALELVLPQTYTRIIELAEWKRSDSAAVERGVLGLDHHTAGKRVAETWGLPAEFQDVIWLHGRPMRSLPELPHRALIGVVTIAGAAARRLHLGWSGDFGPPPDLGALCADAGLELARVEGALAGLPAALADRCAGLGLEETSSPELLLQSIASANRQLHRLNAELSERSSQSVLATGVLAAVSEFSSRLSASGGGTLERVLGEVTQSAAGLLGPGYYGAMAQSGPGEAWLALRCDPKGRATAAHNVEEPLGPGARDASLASLADGRQLRFEALAMLPWMSEFCGEAPDIRQVRLLPIPFGTGGCAVVLHDRPGHDALADGAARGALFGAWSLALTSAGERESARRLHESLAAAGRELAEAQRTMAERESMARLGEMTAGAAHEMNNPLAIIRGRAELLGASAVKPEDQAAARAIAEAAAQASELISALHLLSAPVEAHPRETSLLEVGRAALALAVGRRAVDRVVGVEALPSARLWTDPDLLARALAEVIVNAIEAGGSGPVEVTARRTDVPGRSVLCVSDDGPGPTPRALDHGFDPFFSEKPAGRQRGLGLCRARRWVEALGGRIGLFRGESGGGSGRIEIADIGPEVVAGE